MTAAQKSRSPGLGHLLTAREVAEMIGVSTETLLRWTRTGKVPALHLPSGQVRFRPEAVEAWLDGHANVPATPREAALREAVRIAAERSN